MDAGAAGLVYVRVKGNGHIDAAKPVAEGLSQTQSAKLLELCGAEEVHLTPNVCL